ncbi:hypothetical protein [Microcoleus sp. herbarium12]|uniref:hypothetical protein n=1 Tax=Microcoleus sp. herbarium12 TaxID=3055437 RepID=UPI002FCEDACF
MISNSLELSSTYQRNADADDIVSVLTAEIEAKEVAQRQKNLQRNPLALGKTYIRILEAGGHLGC